MGLITFLFLVCLYITPSFIARMKNNPNVLAISVFNILLGWTVIGWVIALVWALIVPNKN